jgi:Flp pilus assembly protein TadG
MQRLSLQPSRRRRSGQAAQGMVEFALVSGLFFFLLFSVVNAGIFLYSRNTIEYAADVGVAKIAVEGDAASTILPPGDAAGSYNADQVAILYMDAAGVTSIPLVTVTEIDVCQETPSGGTYSPTPAQCASGSYAQANRYTRTGAILPLGNTTVPWPETLRNVGSVPGPDFACLVITYQYHLMASNTTFTLTASTIFRLEPRE